MVYVEAKRIIEMYENKQGSIESLISKSQSPHKNSLTCLIMRMLSCRKLLHKIIKRSKILEREKFLGETLAQLLIYDVLFGMGVRGKFKSAMKRNFNSLNEALDYYMQKHQVDKREELLRIFENLDESSRKIQKPKYIYLNTLVKDKKELLRQLKDDSFERISTDEVENDVDSFNEFIKNLSNNEFVKDLLIKNLYIFAWNSILNKNYHLFKEGHLMQVDKSSCMVPVALNPPENSFVIDAAAAPGNKTILLSTLMKNTGLIYAFDLDPKRVQLMSENLKQHHVKNVRLRNQDFLSTDPTEYERVEYILLDPSCSGSGMTNRFKFGDSQRELAKDADRLWNLEALQRRMLLHAMSFPNVKRIVYSTCSIHREENENVVRYALKKCAREFELVNLFENTCWRAEDRGLCEKDNDRDKYHLDYCIRTSYERNLTNGFFVSCFQRRVKKEHDSTNENEEIVE